ncbi:MAG: bifunctional DNA-formamidopyrimidine glycosylase/DNA-(apurinic or apyrimidinic site) lyase [Rhodobiaceae bacterium]|nr:bifunctional DNA-formamidopyrimidine glycosylase/DNA-(apurinic or apyrimidinic site) lyase [Rhodobiaceae bacterium]
MPELPEVETVRRGLEPSMEGQVIDSLEVRRPNLRFPFPKGFSRKVSGQKVTGLSRRAKYLLIHLDSGQVLLSHLGMSGRFTICPPEGVENVPGVFAHEGTKAAPDGTGKHDHVVFHMETGTRIVYSDHRRFGYMDLIAEAALSGSKHLASLGPEPNGNAFSATSLADALRGKKTPIKSALLDQRVVAGLGNIYVCEALYRARISPKRTAATIAGKGPKPALRAERLAPIIRDVINEAIEAGGSTLRDYAQADGELGYFQHRFQIYGREGEACLTKGCTASVARIVQSGRSSFYCPSCQR